MKESEGKRSGDIQREDRRNDQFTDEEHEAIQQAALREILETLKILQQEGDASDIHVLSSTPEGEIIFDAEQV